MAPTCGRRGQGLPAAAGPVRVRLTADGSPARTIGCPGDAPRDGLICAGAGPGRALRSVLNLCFDCVTPVGGYVTRGWEEMNAMAPAETWQRLRRRLGFDHNPLRRRSDLIEAWLVPAVIAALLVLGPLVAVFAGHWASAQNETAWRTQRSWHHVPAVLLQSAPGPMFPDGGANSWIVWTPARWTAGGTTHVGQVPAISDTRAGSIVTVWLDQAGKVRQPLTAAGAQGRDVTAIALSCGALLLVLVSLALAARRVLDLRRLSGWEEDWMLVGPQWSGQR